MQRRFTLKALTAAVALTGLSALSAHAQSAGTIKVGILHSLSGTMAISETVLKDTVLMAIDEINAKGGVLGKKLAPVCRENQATARSGQSFRHLRLLDIRLPQVGAARG
jgi:urea transport system substrate-binding protein